MSVIPVHCRLYECDCRALQAILQLNAVYHGRLYLVCTLSLQWQWVRVRHHHQQQSSAVEQILTSLCLHPSLSSTAHLSAT